MRSLALAVFLAGISSTAFAADPAHITRTWVPTAFSGASIGTPDAISATDKPDTVHDAGKAWTLTVDAQDGGAFAGTSTGPDGKSGPIVGAFRLDGKRFVMSTTRGGASGEVDGDQLEVCWTDNIPNLIAAGCTVYKRK
jgi:hypothetical protein